MKQVFAAIFVCFLPCIGCQPTPPKPPVWEQAKFKDLAPAKHSTQDGKTPKSPLQFTVYFFSVPASNFADIKDVWANLSTKPIRFAGEEAFRENGFISGAGQTAAWEPVAEKLRAAEGKNHKTINLILFDNSANRISLQQIDNEKNIFYRTQDKQINGVTLGPGEAMLRITAATIPDARGICNLTIEPFFKSMAKSEPILAGTDELSFTTASFITKMSEGDFILLGPTNYAPQDMSLGSIFFSSPDKPVVQLYMIVCTGVSN